MSRDLDALADRLVASSVELTPSEIEEVRQNGYRKAWGIPEAPYSPDLQAKLDAAPVPLVALPELLS